MRDCSLHITHRMFSTRTIAIPEPKNLSQNLSLVTYKGKIILQVFWDAVLHSPIFKIEGANNEVQWFLQKDGNIVQSIYDFLPNRKYAFLDIFLFKDQSMKHGKCANKQLNHDIYKCEWSDFACDKMVIHLNLYKQSHKAENV